MAVQGPFALDMLNGWLTGKTIKAMLLSPLYESSPDHATTADLDELVATGYTAGGLTVTGLTASYVGGLVVLACDDVVFGSVDSPSIGGVAFYETATSKVMSTDLFGPVASTGSGLTYLVDPDSGILTLSPAA